MTFGLGIGLGITVGGSGGGGEQTARRSVAYGTNAAYVKDASGAAQWSFLRRKAYYLPYAVKAGELVEFGFPLWTLERPGSNPVLEVDLAEAYDFQMSVEYPFADSSTSSTNLANRTSCLNTRDGLQTYSYVPGQPARYMVFTWTATADIPAMTPIGVIFVHECVAGRSGGVTNKAINSVVSASTFLGRRDGSSNLTTSHITANATMTRTSFTAPTAGQTGTPATMQCGGIRIACDPKRIVLMSMGNSKLQGANEGTAVSGTLGDGFGDAGGDFYGNTGWGTRLAYNLDIGCSQMSRGSDSYNYQLISGIDRRMEFAAWLNPTHMLPCDTHNDTTQSSTPAWTQKSWNIDDTCINGGNGYICDVPGDSGVSGPSGTGTGIVDGTVRWTFIGANDLSTTGAMSLTGKIRKLIRLYRAAMPNVQIIPPTLTPDAASSVTASGYAYNSGTGALDLTIPDAAHLVVGSLVRVSGLTPSGLNTSGVTNTAVTAIAGNVITVTRPTGLAAPTGTASVNLTWADAAYQTPNTGYAAKTGIRAWMNRFFRTEAPTVLGAVAIADVAKYSEVGNPVIPADETGAWVGLLTAGQSLGSSYTSDGTHETSWGNWYNAQQLTLNEPALVAVLTEAA